MYDEALDKTSSAGIAHYGECHMSSESMVIVAIPGSDFLCKVFIPFKPYYPIFEIWVMISMSKRLFFKTELNENVTFIIELSNVYPSLFPLGSNSLHSNVAGEMSGWNFSITSEWDSCHILRKGTF